MPESLTKAQEEDSFLSIIKDEIIQKPCDIEDLHKLAINDQLCGYFGARLASKDADMIVMPY